MFCAFFQDSSLDSTPLREGNSDEARRARAKRVHMQAVEDPRLEDDNDDYDGELDVLRS